MTEWLKETLGEPTATYATWAIALVIVLILISILFRIWRAFSRGGFGGRGQHRLGVIEAAAVDNKRRLVLVRRDNVEHLVMIGGESDVLIESGINTQQMQAQAQPAAQPRVVAGTPVQTPQTPKAQPAQAPTPVANPAPAPQAQPSAQPAPTMASSQRQAPTPVANSANSTVPPQTANDSAKVNDDMERLLDQLAGDVKR